MNACDLRSFFLLLICALFVQILFGQRNRQTDSLLAVFHNSHDNQQKARLLLKISKNEELSDPMKALQFARQARQLAQIADYDSAEVRAMILMGANLNRLNYLREAIEIGGEVIEKASGLGMQLEIADGRTIMAVAYAQVGDFDNSSKHYFENLKLYEKLNERRLLGRTLGNIGADFISQQNYDKAIEYTSKAIIIAKEGNDLILLTDLYNNLAAIFQIHFHDMPKALHNYYEALKVAIRIDDFQQQGINMLNLSRVFQEMNEPDSAIYYIKKSLVLFRKVNNPVCIADSYIALSDYYYRSADFVRSREYALLALEIGEKYHMYQTIDGASELLRKNYLESRDFEKAYHYLLIRTQANDSLYALQSQKALFKVELQYSQEKIAREQKIRQQRNYYLLGFVIFGLLSGLFVAILFNSRQKIKTKNALLEKDKAEADLKFKSKELSINLLALLKKNELIEEIRQKFTDLEKSLPLSDLREAVVRFNHEIRQSADDRLWQEFSLRFKEINSEFYDKLLTRYPDLTQNELKLCAYLRLNMSTKEIAELTGQSTETLGKARYRLRKKFGLTNSESNLVMFLSQV